MFIVPLYVTIRRTFLLRTPVFLMGMFAAADRLKRPKMDEERKAKHERCWGWFADLLTLSLILFYILYLFLTYFAGCFYKPEDEK